MSFLTVGECSPFSIKSPQQGPGHNRLDLFW